MDDLIVNYIVFFAIATNITVLLNCFVVQGHIIVYFLFVQTYSSVHK